MSKTLNIHPEVNIDMSVLLIKVALSCEFFIVPLNEIFEKVLRINGYIYCPPNINEKKL